MKDGDTVQVLAKTEDEGRVGVARKTMKKIAGREYWVVTFDDGYQAGYEEWELRVVEKRG